MVERNCLPEEIVTMETSVIDNALSLDQSENDKGNDRLANVIVEEYAEALEQVSQRINKKQFSMLVAIFKLINNDKNGTIDPEELRTGISLLNRRLPAASKNDDPDKLFKLLDADGNGTIDLEEFQQLHIHV
jgi:Ca2+-binding EF-hand superfamily protein